MPSFKANKYIIDKQAKKVRDVITELPFQQYEGTVKGPTLAQCTYIIMRAIQDVLKKGKGNYTAQYLLDDLDNEIILTVTFKLKK